MFSGFWNVLLLGKSHSSSWGESSSIVGNPIDVIGSSGVGFSTPGDLVGLVMLLLSPSMVSLRVWGDVRSTILHWVDHSLSLCKSSWKLKWVLCRIKIIITNSFNMSSPLFLTRLIILSISPSIVSLVVFSNLGLSIMVWKVLLLDKGCKWSVI